MALSLRLRLRGSLRIPEVGEPIEFVARNRPFRPARLDDVIANGFKGAWVLHRLFQRQRIYDRRARRKLQREDGGVDLLVDRIGGDLALFEHVSRVVAGPFPGHPTVAFIFLVLDRALGLAARRDSGPMDDYVAPHRTDPKSLLAGVLALEHSVKLGAVAVVDHGILIDESALLPFQERPGVPRSKRQAEGLEGEIRSLGIRHRPRVKESIRGEGRARRLAGL